MIAEIENKIIQIAVYKVITVISLKITVINII